MIYLLKMKLFLMIEVYIINTKIYACVITDYPHKETDYTTHGGKGDNLWYYINGESTFAGILISLSLGRKEYCESSTGG